MNTKEKPKCEKETRVTKGEKTVIEKLNLIKELNLKKMWDENKLKIGQEAIQTKEKSVEKTFLKRKNQQEKHELKI